MLETCRHDREHGRSPTVHISLARPFTFRPRLMAFVPMAATLPFARLVGVGAVVFFANAALLVLQLVASRLLAPFIGSDLYTWTSIIGVFLTGIALGNAYGGKLADRYP